jgi:hypothetical protein
MNACLISGHDIARQQQQRRVETPDERRARFIVALKDSALKLTDVEVRYIALFHDSGSSLAGWTMNQRSAVDALIQKYQSQLQ